MAPPIFFSSPSRALPPLQWALIFYLYFKTDDFFAGSRWMRVFKSISDDKQKEFLPNLETM